MRIRPATPADSARLQAIQLAAGAAFHEVGMPEIADNEPTSIAAFDAFAEAGRSWVGEAAGGEPIAFVLVADVDDAAHIEQVSVDPAHAGRRLGARLVEHVAEWASANGRAALTLTTFRDVAWNGPYYARLGFAEVADPGPELRRLCAEEAAFLAGKSSHPRVVMRRSVPPLHG